MRPSLPLAVLVTLSLAFSGCVSEEDAPTPSSSTSPSGPAPTSDSNRPPTSAPTPSTGSEPDPDGPVVNATPPAPNVTRHEGSFLVRASAGTGPPVGVMAETATVPLTMDATASGYLLILEWSPASQLTQQLHLLAAPSSQHPDIEITGPSPLRLVIPADPNGPEAYSIEMLAAGPVPGSEASAGVNQAFVLTTVMFVGQPVDPAFVPPA